MSGEPRREDLPGEPDRLVDPTLEPTAGAADAGPDADAADGETDAPTEGGERVVDESDAELAAAAQQVEVDLDLLLTEREEFLQAYQRTQADFENYRKQAQRRQDAAVDRAVGAFVGGLLPVLDACDAAVAQGAGEAVEPVLVALYGALEKEGLRRIDPLGEPFDPTLAEAVIHEPGQGGEQVVSEVMRVGYLWKEQVLRPAMVKVTD